MNRDQMLKACAFAPNPRYVHYYPIVQQLLLEKYPDRFNLFPVGKAWRLLLQIPRHYKEEKTLIDWSGMKQVPCPFPLNNTASFS